MKNICLYFQVHQPYRLHEISFFDLGYSKPYFNDELNKGILKKVADKSYLPTIALFHKILAQNPSFQFSLSFSGVVLEQFEESQPEVLEAFKGLIATGNVEVLGETYYHSLSAFYDKKDFIYQVKKHSEKVKELFGVVPRTFRNTELSYQNNILKLLKDEFQFDTILTEGVSWSLKGENVNQVFTGNDGETKILLRNNKLSDDIAFRFSDEQSDVYPLMVNKFLDFVSQEEGELVNLFMDFETIGEHHDSTTGIFDFFEKLLLAPNINFVFPNAIAKEMDAKFTYSVQFPISWADEGKDLSAWTGNSLQKEAISKVYNIRSEVYKTNSTELIAIWEKLTTSDHFYYMSTKNSNDGVVHRYFNPYGSPYNAYIYYMNVVSDLKIRLAKKLKKQ